LAFWIFVLKYIKPLYHINFNEEELKFIKQNPTIVMGGEMDWAPFDYVDKKGQYQGVAKDYLEIFKEKSLEYLQPFI